MHDKMKKVLHELKVMRQNSVLKKSSGHPNGVLESVVPYECWRMPASFPPNIMIFMFNSYDGEEQQYYTTYSKNEKPGKDGIEHMRVSGGFYHSHDYFEFTYVIDGTYSELVVNEDIILHRGELTLLDLKSIHRVQTNPSKSSILYLSFNKDYLSKEMLDCCGEDIQAFFERARINKGKDRQVILFRAQEDSFIEETEEILADILWEIIMKRPGFEAVSKGYMIRFLTALTQHYTHELHTSIGLESRLIMFHEITAYMREHLDTVTISELEERYHYSRNYYNRLFRDIAGLTYSEYLRRIRIECAEEMLSTTDISVRNISQLLGYENRKYFYQIFREKHGITPAEFRTRKVSG